MSHDTRFIYHSSTGAKLTVAEEHILYDLLRETRPDALKRPLDVNEGYHLRTSGGRLSVGRAYLYERRAVERIERETTKSKKLRGLYFPLATPSLALLCQATLYFDEFYIVHPGSTAFDNFGHRYPFGDRDPAAADSYTKSHQGFLERLRQFDDQVLELKRADILHALPPRTQDHPHFIDLITADLGDKVFESIVRKRWIAPAFVAAKKTEPLLPLIGDAQDIDAVRKELRDRASYGNRYDGGKPDLFRLRPYGAKEVDPLLAASILLNHAFLLSGQFVNVAWALPDGGVDIMDVLAILEGFSNAPTAPPVCFIDLIGVDAEGFNCAPDGTTDIVDALLGLNAFSGLSFMTATGCLPPCP